MGQKFYKGVGGTEFPVFTEKHQGTRHGKYTGLVLQRKSPITCYPPRKLGADRILPRPYCELVNLEIPPLLKVSHGVNL